MSDVLAPGQKCGPYTIVREVGRGAMGVVYQAKSPEGEDRAIKTLILKMRMKSDLLERFKREITLLSYIDHVNVVHFYEAGMIQVGGTPTLWVALEFLEGPTLRQIIHERKTPLWADRIARLSRQIADGVTQAHELKVIHRDLKPENVIVSKGDIVKVYDFGIAKFKAQGVKTTGMHDRYGTLRYMAPEQIGGENVDARTDVYALGLMMHEMATGVHPFGALDKALEQDSLVMKQLTETPPPVHEVVSGFPRELSDIIAKAQEKRPENRFDDMSALHAALKGFLQRQAAEKRQFALGPAAESDVARNAQEWEQRLSSTNSDISSARRESAAPGSGSDGRNATPIPSGPATPARMPAVSPSAPPVAAVSQAPLAGPPAAGLPAAGLPAAGPSAAAPRAAFATPPQGGFRAGPATVAIDESPELAALQAPFKAMGPTAPMLAVPEEVKAFAARGPLPMAFGANVPAATAQLADAPIPRGAHALPFTAAASTSDASRALGDTTSSNFRLVQTLGKPPTEERKDRLSGKALAFLAFGALGVGIGVVLIGWLATRQPNTTNGEANARSADSAQQAAGANAAGAGHAAGAGSRGESEHAVGATASAGSESSASAASSAGSDPSASMTSGASSSSSPSSTTSDAASSAASASVASEASTQPSASSAVKPPRTNGGTGRPPGAVTTTKPFSYGPDVPLKK